jgi:hypothetical protein
LASLAFYFFSINEQLGGSAAEISWIWIIQNPLTYLFFDLNSFFYHIVSLVGLEFIKDQETFFQTIVTKKKEWDHPLGLPSPHPMGEIVSFCILSLSFVYSHFAR